MNRDHTEPRSAAEILNEEEFRINPPTPAQLAAWQKRDAAERAAMRRAKADSLALQANIPKRLWELPAVQRAGAWGAAEARLRGLLGTGFIAALTGLRGTGKSQLATELLRHDLFAHVRPVLFVTLTELLMRFKAAYKKDAPETELQVLSSLRRPAFLVIDEVSKSAETPWEQRLFFELLNKRYGDQTDTHLPFSRQYVTTCVCGHGKSFRTLGFDYRRGSGIQPLTSGIGVWLVASRHTLASSR